MTHFIFQNKSFTILHNHIPRIRFKLIADTDAPIPWLEKQHSFSCTCHVSLNSSSRQWNMYKLQCLPMMWDLQVGQQMNEEMRHLSQSSWNQIRYAMPLKEKFKIRMTLISKYRHNKKRFPSGKNIQARCINILVFLFLFISILQSYITQCREKSMPSTSACRMSSEDLSKDPGQASEWHWFRMLLVFYQTQLPFWPLKNDHCPN